VSWRIEHADPLAILRELPNTWAQTCVTNPPRRGPHDHTLAVLGEAHRVLRADGTLWLLHPERSLPSELVEHGWQPHPVAWAGPLTRERTRLWLLTKQPGYFSETGAIHEYARLRTPARLGERPACCGSCPWQEQRELHPRLRRLCILAGTAPLACGACGTPWQRDPKRGRRATCAHNAPGGRCLVLDPFCRSPQTALVAARLGRSFLGITDPQAGEQQ
jgi:hypothetical protein